MSKKSVYSQVTATAVVGDTLLDSPRHWNPGLFSYADRLWLCYRYHLKDAKSRSATAIVPIDPVTLQPIGKSQWLDFPNPGKDNHYEDARLFLFRGEPHISYTEMSSYQPGVDYRCVMKYARLSLSKGMWKVREIYHPRHGRNDGYSKEKNWVFFDHHGELFCVYSSAPNHEILQLSGAKVVGQHSAPAAAWHWGHLRGGSPPLLRGGEYLSIFHSSLPTEDPPHFVRYYAGAYTFSAEPPFQPLRVSRYPIMSGSEADGHKVDPRYNAGWKPWVVFPCGLVENNRRWLISLGVNDWQCVVASMTDAEFKLGPADGSGSTKRYFRAVNGSRPVEIVDELRQQHILPWQVFEANRHGGSSVGYMEVDNPRHAMEISDISQVEEITVDQFNLVRSRTRLMAGVR